MVSPSEDMDPVFAAQFLEIQRAFVLGLPRRLQDIQKAQDSGTRYLALHQLTGAAGGYGFPVLSSLARRAMDAAQLSCDATEALASVTAEVERIHRAAVDKPAIL